MALVPGDPSTVARPEFPHDHAIYITSQPVAYKVAAFGIHAPPLTPLDVVVFTLALCSLVAAGVIALRTAVGMLEARFP